jgi:hypothetical protein
MYKNMVYKEIIMPIKRGIAGKIVKEGEVRVL